MRRRLSNFAATISLLICVLAATFAVRGIWRTDWVSYGGTSCTAMAASIGSSAWLSFWFDAGVERTGFAAASETPRSGYFDGPPTGEIDWLGFSAHSGRTDPSTNSRFGGNRPYLTVIVPHWMTALLAGVLPATWATRTYRARRYAAGRCRRCGYDLRATPDRCPECGESPAQPATA
jgi:hypothetical protein